MCKDVEVADDYTSWGRYMISGLTISAIIELMIALVQGAAVSDNVNIIDTVTKHCGSIVPGKAIKSLGEWLDAFNKAGLCIDKKPRSRAFWPHKNASVWMAYEWALAESTGRPVMLQDDFYLIKHHANDLKHIAEILQGTLATALIKADPFPVSNSFAAEPEYHLYTLGWRAQTTSLSLQALLKSTLVVQNHDELVDVLSLQVRTHPSPVSARWLEAEGSREVTVALGLSFPMMKGAGQMDNPVSVWGQVIALHDPKLTKNSTNWENVTQADLFVGRSLLKAGVVGEDRELATLLAGFRESYIVDGWNECCYHDSISPGNLTLTSRAISKSSEGAPCFDGGLHWVLPNMSETLRKYYGIARKEWIQWANDFRKRNLTLVGTSPRGCDSSIKEYKFQTPYTNGSGVPPTIGGKVLNTIKKSIGSPGGFARVYQHKHHNRAFQTIDNWVSDDR